METREVVIIGAGPAGSSAARKIAEAGHDVLLLEKDRHAGETAVCGGGLMRTFIEDLQLPQGIVEKQVNDWIIYMPSRTYYVTDLPALSFRRCVFDRFLSEDAARMGADLRVQSLVTKVERNDQELTVHIKDRKTGQQYTVGAELVIFADGPRTMAQRFELGFSGTECDKMVRAAVCELEWKDNALTCFEFFFDDHVAPWGYGWVFPKRDILNVGVGCLASRMKGDVKGHLQYLVERHKLASHRLRPLKRIRFAVDVIPIAHASRISGDNMMVVGDAAGMVDPIWGGGIGPAMRGGSIAGQVAVDALEKNKFNASFLSQYEKMWKKTIDYRSLQRAYWMFRLFLKYSRLDRQAFFKFMSVVLWKEGVRELALPTEDLLSKGVRGIGFS